MISIAFLRVQFLKNIFNGDIFNVGHNGKHQSIAMQKLYGWRYKYDNKIMKLLLKTLGPVHIGSGQVMKKQDYIYDFYNSKVYMINGNKLVKFLKEKFT